MRVASVCPTCSKYENALCILYNGIYLPATGIQPLDSVEEALAKIEQAIVFLAASGTITTTTSTTGITTSTTTSSSTSTSTTSTSTSTTTTSTTNTTTTTTTLPPQYTFYTDPSTGLGGRTGFRDGGFVVDRELTVLGFDGIENTDWELLTGA